MGLELVYYSPVFLFNIAHFKNKSQGKLKHVKPTEKDKEKNDHPSSLHTDIPLRTC